MSLAFLAWFLACVVEFIISMYSMVVFIAGVFMSTLTGDFRLDRKKCM